MRSVQIVTVDDAGSPLRSSGISYDRDGDEIYVTSPQKNKLVVLTSDYFPYLSIGSGRGLHSISKTYIRNGLLYVCLGASMAEERPHIAVFDMAFMPVKQIFFPDFDSFSPLDLVVGDNGNLYVVGMNGTGVMVLDSNGKFLHWIEPTDEVLGVAEKAPILAIDIGLDGRLYLLSEGMGRVYVYDQNEQFLYKFGEKGGEPGKLSRPRGIAVDDIRQQIYLVDYQRHTLSVFAKTGEYLFEVGGLGSGRGWFYYPSDVIVDGRGRVIVADTFNHRLQVFEFVNNKGYGVQQRAAAVARFKGPVEPSTEPPGAQAISTKKLVHIRQLKDKLSLDKPGDYLVMTAMTKKRRDAAALEQQLARKGYPVIVREVERAKSGPWQQVLVGPYEEPLEAFRAAEKLRTEEHLPTMLKTRGKEIDLEIPAEKSTPLPPQSKSSTEGGDSPPSLKETPVIEQQEVSEDPRLSVVPLPRVDETVLSDTADMGLAVPAVAEAGVVQTGAALPVKVKDIFCARCHAHPAGGACLQCHPAARKDRT
ncbi:MAG: hypothetical protein GXP51_00775 [Deltaproteobacteria bacterium]|nr:hypothetical protein [Deltaproteobacteria bacterium]